MAMQSPHLPTVFAALSDPTRLAVVEKLAAGPRSVSELSAPFAMAGPSFLKHLRVLEAAGLTTSEKQGRVRTVRLRPEALVGLDEWVARHRRRIEGRLARLGRFLEEDTAS